MKRILLLGVILAGHGLLVQDARSAGIISADATITDKPDGSNFDYSITLTNTSGPGNDNIATFWFSWMPGENFLPTSPISVSPPSGWTDAITNGGSADGFAIQFDAASSSNVLAPGASLTFGFTSADSPAALMGNSPFHPSSPVLSSFVYSQGPLQGDGEQFLVSFASAVPEPSSLVLGVCAVLGSAAMWRFRRRRTA